MINPPTRPATFVLFLHVCAHMCVGDHDVQAQIILLSACDKNTTEERIIWKEVIQYRENRLIA